MHPCAAPHACALAYPKCPCSPEALGPHALAPRCGRPRLASLPPAFRPHLDTCRRILDGKGHPRPVSALRRAACARTPISCPTLTRCIVGPRLRRGRPVCLARVGPHLKSVAHSVCRHLAMFPHGTPDVPSRLSAWPQYLPTVRRRPTAAHLSQRTLMDGLNPIAVPRVVLRGLRVLASIAHSPERCCP
ncbi:UNVERIFIED_CONTAM: hypothetical protein Sradi_6252800 [Sesamum radiatum]|uniref:Uncharacterized protein n=1 Tax=Sesamum radiatum TaxID=300843 RepID=A0AAW2KCA1_SESRA